MKIVLRDNGAAHNDLLVKFEMLDVSIAADTYYLIIANEYKPEISDVIQARWSLTNLLKHWIEIIEALKENEDRYLPIDFSDQYTGCFKVSRIAEGSIEISYGYTLREGWTVNPDDPKEFSTSITDYKQTSTSGIISENKLIEMIQVAIDQL